MLIIMVWIYIEPFKITKALYIKLIIHLHHSPTGSGKLYV